MNADPVALEFRVLMETQKGPGAETLENGLLNHQQE
eukprot:CAMPEP_0177615168 /NCGR_PEP_ID=MMETSP0419_2-20121207/23242_1 /TAXON_ID=582737 /ORGANISM="Tetraselmis sp., Strain GSL018" /LENGTH=35 /DNA_ID= /DNA_START= /DNA_END= /DNA_ORIENTATION=